VFLDLLCDCNIDTSKSREELKKSPAMSGRDVEAAPIATPGAPPMSGVPPTPGEMTAQADEGESIVGPKFVKYWEDHGVSPYLRIPKVEVSVKVYELSKVFEKENSFHAKFCLQLDWEDWSLPSSLSEAVNFEDHFVPRFEINNPGEEIPVAEKGRTIRRKPLPNCPCHVTMTERYVGEMLSRMDVTDFPYDMQLLEFDIKSRPCHVHAKKAEKKYIELSDPIVFRHKEGGWGVSENIRKHCCISLLV
jgi:hypothetical protein